MVQIPSPQPKNPTRKGWIFLLCQYFKFSVVEGYEDDERGSLGIEPERILRMIQRGRRVVQRSKSEMRMHRVFGYRKRHFSDNPEAESEANDRAEVNDSPVDCQSREVTEDKFFAENLPRPCGSNPIPVTKKSNS